MRVNLYRADIYGPWYRDVVVNCILAQVVIITGGLGVITYMV